MGRELSGRDTLQPSAAVEIHQVLRVRLARLNDCSLYRYTLIEVRFSFHAVGALAVTLGVDLRLLELPILFQNGGVVGRVDQPLVAVGVVLDSLL